MRSIFFVYLWFHVLSTTSSRRSNFEDLDELEGTVGRLLEYDHDKIYFEFWQCRGGPGSDELKSKYAAQASVLGGGFATSSR